MAKDSREVRQAIREIAERICRDHGVELFDIEYRSGDRRDLLRVYIDAKKGVTVGECAKVSRELSTQLDVADPIGFRYTLEVSSPGLDRLIRHLDDASSAVGKRIRLQGTFEQGRKRFIGVLVAVEGDAVVIELDATRTTVPWSKVRKANLVPEF